MTDPTEIDVDLDIQQILLVASHHDTPKLRRLIRDNEHVGNPANVQDPETGFTPLHAAIAACEPDSSESAQTNGNAQQEQEQQQEKGGNSEQEKVVQAGLETVKVLLEEGAIWNDLDLDDETPGCLARRLGLREIYETIVDAGVRAELLLNRLDGYEPLEEVVDDGEEGEGEGQQEEGQEGQAEQAEGEEAVPELVEATPATAETVTVEASDPTVTNPRYLN